MPNALPPVVERCSGPRERVRGRRERGGDHQQRDAAAGDHATCALAHGDGVGATREKTCGGVRVHHVGGHGVQARRLKESRVIFAQRENFLRRRPKSLPTRVCEMSGPLRIASRVSLRRRRNRFRRWRPRSAQPRPTRRMRRCVTRRKSGESRSIASTVSAGMSRAVAPARSERTSASPPARSSSSTSVACCVVSGAAGSGARRHSQRPSISTPAIEKIGATPEPGPHLSRRRGVLGHLARWIGPERVIRCAACPPVTP